MAHILIITSGITSIVNANLEMARRLQHAGHALCYGSYSNIESTVSDAGIEFIKLPNLQQPAMRVDTTQAELTDIAQQAVSRVEALSVDLVVIDIECHEYIAISNRLGKRLALVSTFLSLWNDPSIPPLHTSMQPSESGSAAFRTTWLLYSLKKKLRNRLTRIKTRGRDRVSNISRLAQWSGFPIHNHIDERHWLKPLFYRDITVLNLNDATLDFPYQPPAESRFVGPMLNLAHPATLCRFTDEKSAALQQILQDHAEGNTSKLVYCAFGRFKDSYDAAMIERIIECGKLNPDWRFVVSLGGHMQPGQLESQLPNVHLFHWLPQTVVLQHASCALIHAGISSINECIRFEVPMLMYSLNIRDQDGNAARVSYQGLGIAGERTAGTAADMSADLNKLMNDSTYAVNLRAYADAAKDYSKNAVLEHTIASLLA